MIDKVKQESHSMVRLVIKEASSLRTSWRFYSLPALQFCFLDN